MANQNQNTNISFQKVRVVPILPAALAIGKQNLAPGDLIVILTEQTQKWHGGYKGKYSALIPFSPQCRMATLRSKPKRDLPA